jgi:endonuclease G
MKNILILFLLPLFCLAQKADTLINNGVYESLYSYKYGQPTYVKYKLYKGGGNCNRKSEGFFFHGDSIIPHLAADGDDYQTTGYDKGHMANAEDFAYDCKKEEVTFRYYNSVPQTAKLNRGIWKTSETKIREWSQTDSLLIFCGGLFTKKSKPVREGSNLIIPTYCYKIAISLTSHKLLMCEMFENDSTPVQKTVPMIEIEAMTRFFFDRKAGFGIKK